MTTIMALGVLYGLIIWPLLVYGPPLTRDGLNHVVRLAELTWHVQHGDLYPRWFSNLHFGFGAPVLNFYAPLSYYLMLPIALVGLPLPWALWFGFALAIGLLISGTYLWLRDQFNSEWAGLAGAAALGFAPAIYTNTIILGALPPVLAVGFMPWLFWSVLRVVRQPTRLNRALLVGVLVAVVLSHNLQVLFFALPLLLYGLVLVAERWHSHRPHAYAALISLAAGVIISALLAAFLLVPFILEQRHISLSNSLIYDVRDFLMTPLELFVWQNPFDPQLILPTNMWRPPALPWPQTLIGGGALLLALFWRGKLPSQQRDIIVLFAVCAASYLFMVGTWSLPVWDAVPALEFVQFSSRLMQPIGLLFAVLVAGGVARLPTAGWRLPLVTLAIIAAIFVYAIPYTYRAPYENTVVQISPASIYAYELSHPEGVGTTSTLEFVPTAVEIMPVATTLAERFQTSDFPSRLDALPEGVTLFAEETDVNRFVYEVASEAAFSLKVFQFAFPGWQATLDGDPIPITVLPPHGTLVVEVPAGTHRVEIRRVLTTAQSLGIGLTLLGILIGALWLAWWQPQSSPADAPAPPRPTLPVWVAGVRLVFGLSRVGIEALPCTVFQCSVLQSVETPLAVDFDQTLRLLGVDFPSGAQAAAGDVLAVRLLFTALTQLEQQYQLRLALVSANGSIYTTRDVPTPGDVAMPDWPPGRTALEQIGLRMPPDLPPGRYTLGLLVYPIVDGNPGIPAQPNVPGTNLLTGLPIATVEITAPPPGVPAPLGADSVTVPTQPAWPGDAVPLWITLHTGDAPHPNLEMVVSASLPNGERVVLLRAAPAGNAYLPTDWVPNTTVRYLHTLTPPHTLAGGRYPLWLELVDDTGQRLPPQPIGTLAVYPVEPRFSPPPIETPVAVDFGDELRLIGYQRAPDQLITYWEVLRQISTPRTFFVHQLDADGNYIAGYDAPPPRPATSWLPGEFIVLTHPIAPGERFRVGVYDSLTLAPVGPPFDSSTTP